MYFETHIILDLGVKPTDLGRSALSYAGRTRPKQNQLRRTRKVPKLASPELSTVRAWLRPTHYVWFPCALLRRATSTSSDQKPDWPITAVESRYAALGCTGGAAQQQNASAAHAQAQAQDDWRDDGAYRQREAETAAPFFGGFGGG